MSEEFAISYIPRRMKELGYQDHYMVKYRHLVIKPGAVRNINAAGELYLLIDEPQEVTIASEFAVYDLLESNINEISYEHFGNITITNNAAETVRIRFIQVIPKHYRDERQH